MATTQSVLELGAIELERLIQTNTQPDDRNCVNALAAYGVCWALKERAARHELGPTHVSAIKTALRFLDARDMLARKHFPWGPSHREAAMKDRRALLDALSDLSEVAC